MIPLPPAISSRSWSRPPGPGVKVPAGGRISSSSPAATSSQSQPEPSPPGTRFTVIRIGSPVCGELARE